MSRSRGQCTRRWQASRSSPGQNAAIGFRITRSNGQDTADVTTQTISYRANGTPTERTVTSHLRLIITADCDTVE